MGKFKDLTGMTFGRWTVISKAEDRFTPKGSKIPYWNCKCSCGGKDSAKEVNGYSLSGNKSKSCGCHKAEQVSKRAVINLVGQKFGRLIVIERVPNKSKSNRAVVWKCICDCGCGKAKEHNVRGDSLRRGDISSCGCLQKERVSEANTGEKSHLWKGGKTPLNRQIRHSAEYKNWYKKVFERDNYTCRYSGEKGVLSCHHIKPFHIILEENNIITKEQALECKELWDVSNGITLLFDYHSQTSINPKAFHRVYGTGSTEQDFYEWFEKEGDV